MENIGKRDREREKMREGEREKEMLYVQSENMFFEPLILFLDYYYYSIRFCFVFVS